MIRAYAAREKGGKLDQPLIKGTVSNSKPIIFEQIPIQSITSNFQTNLNRLNLDKIIHINDSKFYFKVS